MSYEIELVEKYTSNGQPRFRFRIKDTNIVLNISATNEEEAWIKVKNLISQLKINEIVEEVKKRYKEGLERFLERKSRNKK